MKRLDKSGFTIVELIIAVGIAGVLASVLLAISLTFFGNTVRSQVRAEMSVDSHFMIRSIIEDIRLADSIAAANDITDANAPSGGWLTSDANDVLVINTPATTTDNNVIYNDTTGNPYNNQLVYFVEDNTLYRRQLKNEAAPGNDTRTTCPEGQVTSTCPPDRKFSTYVSSITFEFYDQANTVTTDVTLARSARVGITMSRRVFGQTLDINNSIFTTLRN